MNTATTEMAENSATMSSNHHQVEEASREQKQQHTKNPQGESNEQQLHTNGAKASRGTQKTLEQRQEPDHWSTTPRRYGKGQTSRATRSEKQQTKTDKPWKRRALARK